MELLQRQKQTSLKKTRVADTVANTKLLWTIIQDEQRPIPDSEIAENYNPLSFVWFALAFAIL